MKKLLTLEQLVQFCANNNFNVFNAKDSGYSISVQVPAVFEEDEYNSNEGLMKVKLKVAHILKNRNNSYITEENAKRALPSLKYRPILGYIHQLDNGDYDFHGHDAEIYTNEDGEQSVRYIETQIGCITADEPYLEYDKENDKTYIIAYGIIPEVYTEAASIIRRKEGTKVSCELCINAFSYSTSERCLEIEDFYFAAVTALGSEKDGTEIQEGMKGARLDITDFSANTNSVLNNYNDTEHNKLIEVLEKLDNTLSSFNKDNNEEGGSGILKFEELLQKYGKTIEDITFDYENLTDEELEAKFAEEFGTEEVKDETSADETNDNDNATGDDETPSDGEDEPAEDNPVEGEDADDEGEEDDTIVDENACKKKKKCTIENSDGTTASFEISLDEQICALQDLVNLTYSESDNTYYGVKVYSDYVIMCDYWYGNAYKQSYTVDGENYSLTGDRVKVKATYVTEEEEAALEDMRSNYELIQNELKTYKEAETKAQKDEVFADESYAEFIDTEDFAALKADADKYSVEELRDKADLLFAKLVKASGSFSRTTNEDKHSTTVKVDFSSPVEDKQPYGTLFD